MFFYLVVLAYEVFHDQCPNSPTFRDNDLDLRGSGNAVPATMPMQPEFKRYTKSQPRRKVDGLRDGTCGLCGHDLVSVVESMRTYVSSK